MKKDLIALRDAVKAKKEFEWEFAAKVIGIRPDNRHVHFMKAKNGSVDAALAFLAAVLPGWDWEISSSNAAAVFKGPLLTGPCYLAASEIPARALLIAILDALIAETDT